MGQGGTKEPISNIKAVNFCMCLLSHVNIKKNVNMTNVSSDQTLVKKRN